VLEIVERILAALIILALLTLLIILAFPVPPRPAVAPAPSGDTPQEAQRDETRPVETKTPPPKPAEPKPVDTRPVEPRPTEPKKADRLPVEKDPPPAPRKPAPTVLAKSDSERVERAETHARRNISEAPKSHPIRRVERDVVVEDCPEDDCDCVERPARRRPFWAEPPAPRVVERRHRPYWAQLPAGACPE
jgi:hypothetical protein